MRGWPTTSTLPSAALPPVGTRFAGDAFTSYCAGVFIFSATLVVVSTRSRSQPP